jgi:hypothetical protein
VPWSRSCSILGCEIAAILIAVMSVLTPFAFASPPDQTWIPGFYDNGDHDDVVLLVTDARGTPVLLVVDRPAPLGLASEAPKPEPPTRIPPSAARRAFEGRGPPIA